jgi:hypothetical protein
MKKFVNKCKEHNITLIPEPNCYGYYRLILREGYIQGEGVSNNLTLEPTVYLVLKLKGHKNGISFFGRITDLQANEMGEYPIEVLNLMDFNSKNGLYSYEEEEKGVDGYENIIKYHLYPLINAYKKQLKKYGQKVTLIYELF